MKFDTRKCNSMNKKNILVVGATGGIGQSTVKYLIESGYFVVAVGRNEKVLSDLENKYTDNILVYKYDLTDLDNVESIFQYLKEKNIVLDGMVHSAGISYDVAIRQIDISKLEEVTKVNYMSFVSFMRCFAKKKYTNDGGGVVAISSTAATRLTKSMCIYSASKAALEASVVVAAKELLPRKIRVNAIEPAFVNTPMAETALSAKETDIDAIQPLGLIEPENIASMVEFLLSDKAKYMTASVVTMSAGEGL